MSENHGHDTTHDTKSFLLPMCVCVCGAIRCARFTADGHTGKVDVSNVFPPPFPSFVLCSGRIGGLCRSTRLGPVLGGERVEVAVGRVIAWQEGWREEERDDGGWGGGVEVGV